jgi:cellulose biosynthesis protein BcsQ
MDTIAAIPVRVTPSIISVFTEKGGVGKTSSSLALGWALANAGRRVLLIDGDGQRSLSGWALGTKVARAPYNGNVTAFVNRAINGPQGLLPRTLYEQMMEVHLQTSALRPAHAITLASRLFLVPGHRNTLSFDKVINRTEALTQAGFMAVNNSTGLPYAAVMATAAAVNAEFVLLDLNPNAGDLNRVLVSTSHYVLMPTIADFFCAELITEFQTRLTEFSNEMAVQGPRTQAPQGSYPTPPHMVKVRQHGVARGYSCAWSFSSFGVMFCLALLVSGHPGEPLPAPQVWSCRRWSCHGHIGCQRERLANQIA